MEGKVRGLIEVLSWNFPGGAEDIHQQTSVRITEGVSRHLPYTSLEGYRYANPLGQLFITFSLMIHCLT
jgi:hypothetical protein